MVDDLSDLRAELRALQDDVRRLKNATPLQDASITRGRLRVASEEGLLVEGSAVVSGELRVTGIEVVDGTLRVNGTLELVGDADFMGDVDLTGDLNVAGAGRVKIGTAMTLNPATNGGSIEFTSGMLAAIAGAIGLYRTGGGSVVLNTAANLIGPGCSFVAGATPSISGLPSRAMTAADKMLIANGSGELVKATGFPAKTGMGATLVGCLWADTAGNIYRITS